MTTANTVTNPLTVIDTTHPHRYRYRCNLCNAEFKVNVGKHLIHQHRLSPTAALDAVNRAIAEHKAASLPPSAGAGA